MKKKKFEQKFAVAGGLSVTSKVNGDLKPENRAFLAVFRVTGTTSEDYRRFACDMHG